MPEELRKREMPVHERPEPPSFGQEQETILEDEQTSASEQGEATDEPSSAPASVRAVKQKPTAAVPQKDPLTSEIESILSANLEEAYKTLDPKRKAAFKLKGEEIAQKIREEIRKQFES